MLPRVAWLLALSAALVAGGGAPPPLDFDRLFDPAVLGRGAAELRWDAAGERLAWLWGERGERTLELLDVASGERRTLLDADRSLPGPVTDYRWSPAGGALLIEAAGDLFLYPLGGELERLTETPQDEVTPRFSPTGDRLTFVRDDDLWLLDLPTRASRQLTRGGGDGGLRHGITDWVYWEEIWDRTATGHWWSPRGDRIAYYAFDDRAVPTYPLLDFAADYPKVERQRYPKAGEANPIVRVGVLDPASGATVWMDTGEETDVYLARVDWTPGGDRLAVQRLDRDQERLDLLLCDPAAGDCRTLLTERDESWIDLSHDLRFLSDGRFVWSAQRDGGRRLYLYRADGSLARTLTPPDQIVTGVDALREAAGQLLYTAYATGELGAAHRRIFRVALAGGAPRPLSPATGWSGALAAPRGGLWVHTYGRSDLPSRSVVRDLEGDPRRELPSEPPAALDLAALPQWELITLPGPGGVRLPAARLLPPDRVPGRRYPAVMYQYGGPASQVVADRWPTRERMLWHRMMAARGYVVLLVDNEASLFFGKHGADRLHRRFGEVNLAAQRAGVEYLEGLGFVDPGRIGLWGWSGGGANTLYCLTHSPGTWRAGVAGAPVADWRLYDSIWTERYLDHPADNPAGYRDSSAVNAAGELRDALLIVHGTADDNVHPQNTMVMSRALIDAGLPFEQAIYPGQKHGFRGADLRHFYERMTEFFDRQLAP